MLAREPALLGRRRAPGGRGGGREEKGGEKGGKWGEEMGDGEEGEGGAFVTAALSGDGGGEKQRWSRARRQRLCPWR